MCNLLVKNIFEKIKERLESMKEHNKDVPFDSIEEVLDTMINAIKKNEGIAETLTDGASIAGLGGEVIPVISTFMRGMKAVSAYTDQRKLEWILQGLARGNDVEGKLYALKNYVSNENRAFQVSEFLRKILLGSSELACCIMGVMLANLSEGDKKIGLSEHIVASALWDVNDSELLLFEKMYDEFVIEDDGARWIRLDKEEDESARMELRRAEEYFVQKRVFLQNHDIMTGSAILGDAYAEVTESADLLRQYMERVAPVVRMWRLDN